MDTQTHESPLKRELDSRGIRYSFLAERANIPTSTLHGYLRGRIPPADVAQVIAEVVGVPLSQLFPPKQGQQPSVS